MLARPFQPTARHILLRTPVLPDRVDEHSRIRVELHPGAIRCLVCSGMKCYGEWWMKEGKQLLTRTLLGAPSHTTRNKKLLETRRY